MMLDNVPIETQEWSKVTTCRKNVNTLLSFVRHYKKNQAQKGRTVLAVLHTCLQGPLGNVIREGPQAFDGDSSQSKVVLCVWTETIHNVGGGGPKRFLYLVDRVHTDWYHGLYEPCVPLKSNSTSTVDYLNVIPTNVIESLFCLSE